jgi:hypothetical protein
VAANGADVFSRDQIAQVVVPPSGAVEVGLARRAPFLDQPAYVGRVVSTSAVAKIPKIAFV